MLTPVSSRSVAPVSVRAFAPALWSLLLTFVVLGPLLNSSGYLLLRDAVSTPRSFLTDSALGLSDAAARAVPQDALLAWVTTVIDGGRAVTVILALSVWAAGWGTARLVAAVLPRAGVPGQLVAVTVAIWNPYVAERLLQGHWSLLAGYAALPWAMCAAVTIRRRRRGGWPALALRLAAAGLTPTGVLLAAVGALVVLAVPGGRVSVPARVAGAVALSVCASMPWLTATFLTGGGSEADPAGVRAFAGRAEPMLGTLGSLAGLGGIWNAEAVPESRTTPWALLGTVLLLVVVGCGVPALWRRRRHPVVASAALLAVVAVLGPAAAATSFGLVAGEWSMENVPGAGLLRDTQKWVALAMPGYALAAAAGVGALRRRFSGPAPVWATAVIAALLLALPDLAWGVSGQIRPVHYPDGWQKVTESVTARDGDVAVLPGGMFRIFDFSGPAAVLDPPPVLDPLPRMVRADVLQTGTLLVAGGAVSGEGHRAVEVERLLLTGAHPSALAAQGVGWVVVEHGTPGDHGESQRTLAALEQVYGDDDLSLYRVDGVTADASPHRASAVAAQLGWLLMSVCGAVGVLVRRFARARKQP